MEEITQKLKKIMDSRKNKKIIYKQSNVRAASLFVEDISERYNLL